MADGDRQAGLGGEHGEFDLPGADSVAVGAAAVGADQEPAGVGVAVLPTVCHQRRRVPTANAEVS